PRREPVSSTSVKPTSTARDDGGEAHATRPAGEPAIFTGVAISPGVGMGPAWLEVDLLGPPPDPPAIARDQIPAEWSRVVTSFEQTRRQLDDSALRIEEQFDAALAGIFRAHALMLDGILSSGD